MSESPQQPAPGSFSALMAGASAEATKPDSPKAKPSHHTADKSSHPTARHTTRRTASMTAVFDAEDIADLWASAYIPQTFRFSEKHSRWLTDVTEMLDKRTQRPRHQKVNKVDVVRISLKLFEKFLAEHPAEVLRVLREI